MADKSIVLVLQEDADTEKAKKWVELFIEEYDPDNLTIAYYDVVTWEA
jgi:hypothetical protein